MQGIWILEVIAHPHTHAPIPPEVYIASFGGDVKPSVPGDLV